MLNGCRVDVRQSELAPIAIDDEASKKSVSMVYYENHNYGSPGKHKVLPRAYGAVLHGAGVARETDPPHG